jgi:hypothetical protein
MSKPVAWRVFRGDQWTYRASPNASKEERALWQPLYAHRQEWQGLTEEDVKDIVFVERSWADAVRKVEAKLKEKNR